MSWDSGWWIILITKSHIVYGVLNSQLVIWTYCKIWMSLIRQALLKMDDSFNCDVRRTTSPECDTQWQTTEWNTFYATAVSWQFTLQYIVLQCDIALHNPPKLSFTARGTLVSRIKVLSSWCCWYCRRYRTASPQKSHHPGWTQEGASSVCVEWINWRFQGSPSKKYTFSTKIFIHC